MPDQVVYREIEELTGITLEDYLQTLMLINSSEKGSSNTLDVEGGGGHVLQNPSSQRMNVDFLSQSKKTFFTEVEAIDLILKIVDLVDTTLHSHDILHTNLCP